MPASLSISASFIALASALVLFAVLRSFNDTLYALDLAHFSGPSVSLLGKTKGGARGDGAGSCRMAWMNPSYIPLGELKSRFQGKYHAYLYREHGLDPDQPRGSPVLFVPGNAGSFRQTRSFAAAAAKLYHRDNHLPVPLHSAPQHPGLDFFTLDFKEDLSAFHGQTLVEQAEYANDLVTHILDIYANSRKSLASSLPVPTSVLIVAHSMGGIVARKMIRMPNYQNGSINTIISLSTPHTIPPITLDRGIETVYDDINKFWRMEYFEKGAASKNLENLILVSISGSTSDTTVSPDSSSLLTLAPPPYGLTVYSTGMPEVWTPIDHRAILWCDQFRKVIAKALLAITDARRPSQVKSLQERASILKSYLSNGHGLRSGCCNPEQIPSWSSDQVSYTHHSPLARIRLDEVDLVSELFAQIVPLKTNSGPVSSFDAFTLLTNIPLGIRLNVLACNGTFQVDRLTSCRLLTTQHSTVLPASHFHPRPASIPGPDDEADPLDVFNFIQVPHSELSTSDFVAIATSKPSTEAAPSLSDPAFVISEFCPKSASQTIDASLWSLLLWGLNLPSLSPSSNVTLVSELYLPGMDSSSLAFKVQVTHPSKCEVQPSFAPLMRQQTLILNASRFHPNIHSAILSTHFSTAYSPIPPSLIGNHQEGMKLTFWIDPYPCSGKSDNQSFKLTIRIDWYESARKIILLYRTALVAMPLGVASIAFAFQIHCFRTSGHFPPLGVAISVLTRAYLLKFLVIIIGLQLLQSAILNSRSLHTFFVTVPTWISGLLLGDRHPSIAWLDCLIIVVGLGWTSLAYIVVNSVCVVLSKVWLAVIGVHDVQNRRGMYGLSVPVSRRMISVETLALLILVLVTTFMAPYQLAFLTVLVFHLFRTLRALAVCTTVDSYHTKSSMAFNRFHYYFTTLFLLIWLTPGNMMILTIWIKNLRGGWYKPFSSDRNLIYMLGYLLWFRVSSLSLSQSMFSTSEKRSLLNLVIGMALSTGIFSFLYGIRYTFRIFDFVNLVFASLALLHHNTISEKLHS